MQRGCLSVENTNGSLLEASLINPRLEDESTMQLLWSCSEDHIAPHRLVAHRSVELKCSEHWLPMHCMPHRGRHRKSRIDGHEPNAAPNGRVSWPEKPPARRPTTWIVTGAARRGCGCSQTWAAPPTRLPSRPSFSLEFLSSRALFRWEQDLAGFVRLPWVSIDIDGKVDDTSAMEPGPSTDRIADPFVLIKR